MINYGEVTNYNNVSARDRVQDIDLNQIKL